MILYKHDEPAQKEVRGMLEFKCEWERVQQEDYLERNGEWRRMDHYGPICSFKVKKYGDNINVFPSSIIIEGAENAIGDFNIFVAMSKELFAEFGTYALYIPKLRKFALIDSADTEQALVSILKTIQLL